MAPLPEELAAALGAQADSANHVRLGAGLDSFLGETHVVLVDGVLRAWTRSSILDPLKEVGTISDARVEESSLGAELVVQIGTSESRVRLGYTEREQVIELLPRREVEAPLPSAEPTPELDQQRAELLGVVRGAQSIANGRVSLLGVLGAKRDVLERASRPTNPERARRKSDRREDGATKETHRKQKAKSAKQQTKSKQSKSKHQTKSKQANHQSKHVARPKRDVTTRTPPLEARTGEPWMPPPPATAPQRSVLPWLVLIALLLVGFIPAITRLIAEQ